MNGDLIEQIARDVRQIKTRLLGDEGNTDELENYFTTSELVEMLAKKQGVTIKQIARRGEWRVETDFGLHGKDFRGHGPAMVIIVES